MDKPEQTKITVPGSVYQAIEAMKSGKSGAERMVLEALALQMLSDTPIDPGFQRIVNAVVLKAVALEKLPDRPTGRPSFSGGPSLAVAARYWELRDSGVPYAKAVESVSNQFSKSERHVMRLANEHLDSVGETKEAREIKRAWWDLCAEMGADGSSLLGVFESSSAENKESPMAAIESLIRTALDATENN